MKKHIVVPLAFAIASVCTTGNSSEWLSSKWQDLKRSDWYRGLPNPKPTYYKGYSDWLLRNNPSLFACEYEYECNPRTLAELNNLNKAEYEGINPYVISNLKGIRSDLIKEEKPYREEYLEGPTIKSRWQNFRDPSRAEFQEKKRRILSQHIDELGKFTDYQERFLPAYERYKSRKPWLSGTSFGFKGKGQYGESLSYPERRYAPYSVYGE